MNAAYERGRSDAGEGAHVRSNDEEYLRGYAERVLNIPGSPSIEVHIARSDAWAARPPSRTDAAYLAAYEREIRDCQARTKQGTDDWYRREGMKDAVQRKHLQCTHLLPYLRGYAEAGAVLLGAPAAPPAPAPAPKDSSWFSQLEVE